jgi:hypothetical protein
MERDRVRLTRDVHNAIVVCEKVVHDDEIQPFVVHVLFVSFWQGCGDGGERLG